MCDTPVAQSPPLCLLCNTRLAKSLVSGLTVTAGPVCCPTNPRLPSFSLECKPPPRTFTSPPTECTLEDGYSRLERTALEKSRQTRANLDLKSWNKILRSGGRRGPVWKYLHSMVFVAAGQVDKAPLRVRLLRGRKAASSFHSDAIIHGLTLTGRGRQAPKSVNQLPIGPIDKRQEISFFPLESTYLLTANAEE